MQILLDVWRETCRHIEITESIVPISEVIGKEVPGDYCVIRRLDPERLLVETAGVGRMRGDAQPGLWPTRSECQARAFQTVMAWSREGRVRSGRAGGADPVFQALVPAGIAGPCLAGPLRHESGLLGAVLVVGSGELPFRLVHEDLLQSLLEPLSVALANHHRLHDMARMRAALEADKTALLSRLGRPDVVDAIVGADTGLREVMERVEQVAQTDVPVLLIGETGTGKEVVARAVHARSHRASAPVVRVNCGAIPAGLIDSELFGHERGSFTGAVSQRQGWFERADGGTLFLDEIGELPLEAQVRLLRILQDGSFERVGGERTVTVDVRIVAATHRDLREMVAERTFREDLWYRLSVFPIRLPTLRERPEDIALLASHFAARTGLRLGGKELTLSPADLALLRAHQWPGNVRELGAVIERAAIFGGGRELRLAAALGVSSDVSARKHGSPLALGPLMPASGTSLPPGRITRSFDDAQREHIARVVSSVGGRIAGAGGAATLLGINPHTLRARMRKLGISPSAFHGGGARGRNARRGNAGRPLALRAGHQIEEPDLAQAMRRHVEGVLRDCGGRVEGPRGAAAQLDVNPHTLRARLRKLGIDVRSLRTGRH